MRVHPAGRPRVATFHRLTPASVSSLRGPPVRCFVLMFSKTAGQVPETTRYCSGGFSGGSLSGVLPFIPLQSVCLRQSGDLPDQPQEKPLSPILLTFGRSVHHRSRRASSDIPNSVCVGLPWSHRDGLGLAICLHNALFGCGPGQAFSPLGGRSVVQGPPVHSRGFNGSRHPPPFVPGRLEGDGHLFRTHLLVQAVMSWIFPGLPAEFRRRNPLGAASVAATPGLMRFVSLHSASITQPPRDLRALPKKTLAPPISVP